MTSNPSPSPPRMAVVGTSTPDALTGLEQLPRRPSPSNGAPTFRLLASAGTNQIVLAPSPPTGLLDQT